MDFDVEDNDKTLFDDFPYLVPKEDIGDELHEYLREETDCFDKN